MSYIMDKTNVLYMRSKTGERDSLRERAKVEHWARKVVEPYVNIVRKREKVAVKTPVDHYNYFLTKKSSDLLKNLSIFIANSKDLPMMLYETSSVLKSVTNSIGARTYLVEKSTNQLYQFQKSVPYPKCRVNFDIEMGTSVAAHVAYTREYVCVEDVSLDSRFPDGVSYKTSVKAVLCAPIVTANDTYAVIELYRDAAQEPYTKNDMKIIVLVCGWIGLTIQQNQDGLMLHRKQEVNNDLIHLVLAYFGKTLTLETMLADVLNYSKHQLSAERGAFYIFVQDKGDLIVDVYEEGVFTTDSTLIQKKISVNIANDNTVPAMVARTGELVNIKDMFADPRFNKDKDVPRKEAERNYINRSELCAPIKSQQGMIGMFTLINKKDGTCFTNDDEELIKIVVIYCCMALNHSKVLKDQQRAELHLEQTRELLLYHLKPCEHKMKELNMEVEPPKNIREFHWYIQDEDHHLMPQLYLYMIKQIVGVECINIDALHQFVYTVQQCYRSIPYHNFEHAFNVSHCMYTVLLRNKDKFTLVEKQALMVSVLCHDVDHGGCTNNFLVITDHLLSRLYSGSQWENHHVFVTMLLLSKYKIFNNLDEQDWRKFTDEIKENILATDLLYYFKARLKLKPLLDNNTFNINNSDHKFLTRCIMMTLSDLSGLSKFFNISKRLTDAIYMEFYEQGDYEKMLGLLPLSLMDRNTQDQVPDDQVKFLTIGLIACSDLLQRIFSNTAEIHQNCLLVRDTWKRIIETRGEKIWRQTDSQTV